MQLQKDYSWIKGFNYVPTNSQNGIEFWRDYDEKLIERELRFGQRLGFNCVRPFLSYIVYKNDPQKFLDRLLHFVRTADSMGICTIPVVWDSCFTELEPVFDSHENEWYANPGTMYLDEKFWVDQERYCHDLIRLLKDEPGLLLWDVHNEPMQTSYVFNYDGDEKQKHIDEIWKFTRNFCRYFKANDKVNPITVGIDYVKFLPDIHDACDILSFHDYSSTREEIDMVYRTALEFAAECKKPVFCSELACPARGNPYDVAIEAANRNNTGYILWELMIGKSQWNDRHGIVYPDGTLRDPSIVAAVLGFFRSREAEAPRYNLNTEYMCSRVLKRAQEWLDSDAKNEAECMQVLEIMCNLIESGEMLPMYNLPSVQLKQKFSMESAAEMMKKWMGVLAEDISRHR